MLNMLFTLIGDQKKLVVQTIVNINGELQVRGTAVS